MSTVTKAPRQTSQRRDPTRMRQVMAETITPAAVHADNTDPEAREIQEEILALREEREQDERQIVRIHVAQLQRHPQNRIIDPNDPSIESLGQSMLDNGQLEPLRVRQIDHNAYQIISGERRYTAMKLKNIALARCIVVNIDEAAALREVAVANSNREDLNPIQRAELMQTLMKPKDKGGSGLTLIEAGKLFGLTSESGCKNAMRLLKLPAGIQQRLISGELPERFARALIPYAEVDVLMKEVVKDLSAGDYSTEDLMGSFISEEIPHWMTQCLQRDARPISKDLEHWHQYPIGNQPCLFDWEPHAEKLQVIEVPTSLGYDGKAKRYRVEPRKWALNTKLWHKLQDPLAKKASEEGKSKQKSAKDTKSKATPEKKLTPKEQAALDKKRAAEADKQLDNFTKEWACRMLRCTLASLSNDDALVCATLPWLLSHCGHSEIQLAHEHALLECQVISKRSRDLLAILPKAKANDSYDVLCAMWRIILWPVTRLIGDAAKQTNLAPAGQLPDRLISLGYHGELKSLQQILAMTKVSMETAWQAGTVDDSDERRLISVWLLRHTKAQLQKLRDELNVIEGAEHMGRDELAECILRAHRSGKPLRLPKRLGAIK